MSKYSEGLLRRLIYANSHRRPSWHGLSIFAWSQTEDLLDSGAQLKLVSSSIYSSVMVVIFCLSIFSFFPSLYGRWPLEDGRRTRNPDIDSAAFEHKSLVSGAKVPSRFNLSNRSFQNSHLSIHHPSFPFHKVPPMADRPIMSSPRSKSTSPATLIQSAATQTIKSGGPRRRYITPFHAFLGLGHQ